METNGLAPSIAKALAKTRACSSAIPTSIKRSGYFSLKQFNLLPLAIAGVIAIIFLSFLAILIRCLVIASLQEILSSKFPSILPVLISKGPTPCQRPILSSWAYL